MIIIVGLVIVFVGIFGGYVLSGGKLGIILHALPFEDMMIGGAAVGSFLASNGGAVAGKGLKGIGRTIKGSKWKKQDYQDSLSLLFAISKMVRTKGPIALEAHIENPEESTIFSEYPKILHDHFAVEMITDYLRMTTMNFDDVHQIEEIMEKEIEKHHHEEIVASDALQGMADALPALGIVAAVLGVIKTMASISEPPEILGFLIGGALVGTFLGVLLAYGVVGPLASRLKGVIEEDGILYKVIKDVMVAHLHGNSPQISVEIGRQAVPSKLKPSFYELEEALAELPVA
ncbi:MAG: flagellar motor stator protein MotA [Alphaproteobacteria bacterium]|nr:flagellar motor stator protein MotA [Alphaproteobacteria bacterium]